MIPLIKILRWKSFTQPRFTPHVLSAIKEAQINPHNACMSYANLCDWRGMLLNKNQHKLVWLCGLCFCSMWKENSNSHTSNIEVYDPLCHQTVLNKQLLITHFHNQTFIIYKVTTFHRNHKWGFPFSPLDTTRQKIWTYPYIKLLFNSYFI